MLFVSPHPGYQLLGIKQPNDNYNPTTGQYMSTTPGIDAEFVHGGCPSWAQEAVIDNPMFQQRWGGLPDDTDRHLYIATFDTTKAQAANGWDEATKKMVEDTLLNHPDNGNRYIVVKPPIEVSDLPWPNYTETHHFHVVKVAKEIGADLREVLEYEKNHRNRKVVVQALEEELGADVDELVPA